MKKADKRAVDLLRVQGDRGSIPRPVNIWFYGDLDELLDLKEKLEAAGWEATEPEPCDRTYMLRAEREQSTSPEAMETLLKEIEAEIVFTDIVFDGWETTVEVGQ